MSCMKNRVHIQCDRRERMLSLEALGEATREPELDVSNCLMLALISVRRISTKICFDSSIRFCQSVFDSTRCCRMESSSSGVFQPLSVRCLSVTRKASSSRSICSIMSARRCGVTIPPLLSDDTLERCPGVISAGDVGLITSGTTC